MNGSAPGLSDGLGATSPPCENVEPDRELRRRLPVIESDGVRVEPPVRGEWLLRAGDSLFTALEAAVARVIHPEYNPFSKTGAIANTSFIIACVTGVIVLIWYRTSVHQAYTSVAAMSGFAALVRSLHRYSSDAALLFALLHASKLFLARRFGGARWLAWITGMFVVFMLWLVGWLGYWLVWDERGHKVALATAHLLDALPIFAEPLSRAFLTDEGLSSLLFFVVFFLHMLIPLAMGVGLWLHITRLARPEFLTKTRMTLGILGSLVVLSLLAPADLAAPAKMAVAPRGFAMDAWFLLPITLADRLESGAAWAITLLTGALVLSVPWALAGRRARRAVVVSERCTACEKCYLDCPYDAIRMGPRKDDRPYPTLAVVDGAKCIGCGVCAGSCDSAGIGLPWFDAIEQRHRIDELIRAAQVQGQKPALALVCAESAAAELTIDRATAAAATLPDYNVVRVPCAGWIHPLLVERALKRGAERVLVVSCRAESCRYREGGNWTKLRMNAEREPKLRLERVLGRVKVVEFDRHERRRLIREARAFARGRPTLGRKRRHVFAATVGLLLVASISGLTWAATQFAYRAPGFRGSELTVSFKLAGRTGSFCRPLSEGERRRQPIHMQRREICERRRPDIQLRVSIDGREALRKAYPPRGVWRDGPSIGLERIQVPSGSHTVRIEIGDSANANAFPHASQRTILFERERRVVVLFDQSRRFSWH